MRIHPPYLVIGVFAAAALLAAFVVSKTVQAQRARAPGEVLPPKGLERLAPPGPPGALSAPAGETGVVAGRVAADQGALPAGVAVYAQRAGGSREPPLHADVAPNGLYRLVLPPGDWRLWAAPAHAADARATPAFAKVAAGAAVTLDLVAATAAAGLAIAVLEPDGTPAGGAVVTLGRPGDARLALATAADPKGTVAVAGEMGLAGAPVEIHARAGGRAGAWTGTLPQAGVVTVKLAPAAVIEGVVAGARGAKAPAGFVLTVSSQPAPQSWRTVAEHRFTGDRFVVPDLPAEPLRLSVKTDDGRSGAAEVRPAAGATAQVRIEVGTR